MTSSKILKSIPIECLQRGQYQPRKRFDEQRLKELAQSILTQGLIEPLVVRQQTDNTYEIIAGERRWRAAMLAGLPEVPCLISEYDDEQAAAISLVENIQRENLSVIEEANGYQRLVSEFHFNQAEVATLMGKSRSHIANLLRLLTLCRFVQEKVHHSELSLGHARMLVGLEEHLQIKFARLVIDNHWSVRKLEEEVRVAKLPIEPLPQSDRDITRLETQIAEQIGTPVQILPDTAQGGWLKIKFYNNDTLAGLLDRMGLSYD
jgi:ParB family chromosome partitioning protein